METSAELCDYLDKKYCLEIDIYEIAEIINLNMRHVLNKIRSDSIE